MLAGNMKGQGEAFFSTLEKSGLLEPEELNDLRTQWQELIEKRIAENEGAAEGLKDLMGDFREAFRGEKST
jgi:hypothetical protein